MEVNGFTGIDVNGIVTNNTVSRNGINIVKPGIRSQGTIIGNHAVSNSGNGIETENAGSLVKNNIIIFNDGDGVVDINGASAFIGNQIRNNGDYGLNLHSDSGYVNLARFLKAGYIPNI